MPRHRPAIVVVIATFCLLAGGFAQNYVVTNNDDSVVNTGTFFQAVGSPTNPSLDLAGVIKTGGMGLSCCFEYLATNLITIVPNSDGACVYFANVASGSIAGYDSKTGTVVGPFQGSPEDARGFLSLNLAASKDFLYAAFEGSTIVAFKILSGCRLSFTSGTSATGLNGGWVDGMKTHGDLLVVTFGDGSYESFNISNGTPVSSGDAQFSNGFRHFGDIPSGVDISANGKWAIFGDGTRGVDVEVAAITPKGLSPTYPFVGLETAHGSTNVWLSPDNTLLYVGNNDSGQISAYNFDASTGKLSFGCVSNVLNKFLTSWDGTGSIQTEGTTGTGGVIWMAEFGRYANPSSIAIIEVTSHGSSCTLTESPASPITVPNGHGLLNIAAFPTRGF